MAFRLVDAEWRKELKEAAAKESSSLTVICPFIKKGPIELLLSESNRGQIRVITRFNLRDFAEGVSDISALESLLRHGAQIRGVKNLHAKMYLFGTSTAVVTSANLTEAALARNHEFGFVTSDPHLIRDCQVYFEKLWKLTKTDLAKGTLADWDSQVRNCLAHGATSATTIDLPDHGASVEYETDGVYTPPFVAEADQFFVKFFGTSTNRIDLQADVLSEIQRAGCHKILTYPASKRPRNVRDGALMFIARLTKERNDIVVYGRAIGMEHLEGRDEASLSEIETRPFKSDWPNYIRVHHAEFVAGKLENGVSLSRLMDALESKAFTSTSRNLKSGGNTDPRRAFMQQPAVELTREGAAWLTDELSRAFERYGTIPQADLDEID